MLTYNVATQTKVRNFVRSYTSGHGGEYCTPWPVIETMLDQFPSNKGTWAILFNLEKLFATIAYKKVDPSSITFFEDCPDKKALAISWGCKTAPASVLLNKAGVKIYMKQFDNSISNVPYNTREDSHKGSVGVAGGKMGTVGDKTIGRKLNRIQREITKDGGCIAQMGLKTGMLDEALIDESWNPITLSLMVDRQWWDYNTFWLFGKKEANQNQYQIYGADVDSQICAKVFGKNGMKIITQSDSYQQLLSKGFITSTPNGNPMVIVRNQKKNDMQIIRAYPTDSGLSKVVHGPKFTHYMQESSVTWLVTDEPMLCDCAIIYPHKSLALAKKQKLFTEKNPLLKFMWKKMKYKGLDHFWRYAKQFDLLQIKTGLEFPVEYGLSPDQEKYINENFGRI